MADRSDIKTRLAQILGIIIGLVAIAGLFMQGHFLGLINVDWPLNLLRIIVAAALLYVGFRPVPRSTLNATLRTVGILYLIIGILGFLDIRLFGLTPNGLTGFDVFYHLVIGALATWAGSKSDEDNEPRRA